MTRTTSPNGFFLTASKTINFEGMRLIILYPCLQTNTVIVRILLRLQANYWSYSFQTAST